MYIFISEKNDISTELAKTFLKSVQSSDGIHKVGTMHNGEQAIVLTAQGHILSMKQAWDLKGISKEEHYKNWNETGEIFKFSAPNDYLKFLDVAKYSGRGINPQDRIDKFKELLTNTNDVKFVCATDPDDEGAAIFANLMEYFGFDPYADNSLAIYTGSVTVDAFKAEFKKMKKFSERKPEVERARARSLFDATYGWNVTNSLHKPMGRLKGAIISLIGENEFAKRNHVKSFKYAIDILYGGEKFTNTFTFETKSEAEEAIKEFKENGISISDSKKVKKASKGVPHLHNEISITKAVGSRIDGDISKVANDLRLKHKLITYMRTKDTVVGADTAKSLNKNIKNFSYMPGFDLVKELPKSSIATGKIDHDAIHVTGKLPTGLKLTEDEEIVFDEVLRRVMANMAPSIKFNEHKTTLSASKKLEWFTGYTFTENVITDYGFMTIYPEDGIRHVAENELKSFTSEFELEVREIESKPKGRFNEASMKTKLDKIASDIDDEELKALYKDVGGIGTTATVGPTLVDMAEKGMIQMTGKGKTLKITEDGYKMFLHMKKHNVPLIDLKTSAIMEKNLNEVRDGKLNVEDFLNGVIPEIEEICQVLLKNPMLSSGKQGNRKVVLIENATCPKCKKKDVRMAYVTGKSKNNNKPYAIAQCEDCEQVTFLQIMNKLMNEKQAKKWLQGEPVEVKGVKWTDGTVRDFYGKLNFETDKWEFINNPNEVRKVNGAMIYKGHYIKNEVTVKVEGKDKVLKITEATVKKLVDKQEAEIKEVKVAASFSIPRKEGDFSFINLTVVK